MRIPAWAWAFAAAASSLAVVAACVGDDPPGSGGVQPDPNAKPGEFRGRCDTGRCLTGLRCDTAIDICVPDGDGSAADGGGSSGNSNSGSSSGMTSSSSSGVAPIVCPFDAGKRNEVPCPNVTDDACADGGTCCAGDVPSCTARMTTCPAGTTPIECVGRDTCTGQDACCLVTNAGLSTSACNMLPVAQVIETRCSPDCSAADDFVCHDKTECPAHKPQCRKLTITSANGDVEIGVCF